MWVHILYTLHKHTKPHTHTDSGMDKDCLLEEVTSDSWHPFTSVQRREEKIPELETLVTPVEKEKLGGSTHRVDEQKTGCDSCYWDICYWLWLLGDNRESTLTGEGGFAKLRCAYRSTAMSFWLASSAMERAVLPSCKRATDVTNQNKHFRKS